MPTIHRFTDDAVPVNAYLVETADAVVAVDGTLTVQGGRGLRARLDRLGKPLAGVLMTHSHPDHYGGLVELLAGADAPVFATAGVAAVIERDDPVKEQILRPMFGAAWPAQRRFPDRRVAAGETIALGGASFTVVDLGPGESRTTASGCSTRPARRCSPATRPTTACTPTCPTGSTPEWLANIERLKADLPAEATLYVGHGEPGGLELLDRQARYIEAFVEAVRAADWSEPEAAQQAVVEAMLRELPTDDLRFLMELSVEPVARGLMVR